MNRDRLLELRKEHQEMQKKPMADNDRAWWLFCHVGEILAALCNEPAEPKQS